MEQRIKNFNRPDQRMRLERIESDMVEVGDITVGHIIMQPGWRWSVDMKPRVGGDVCQARHVGVVLKGRFGVSFPDGTRMEMGPGDVFDIPPGHDGYTIGEETCEQIEWVGLKAWTGFRPGATRVLATLLFSDIVGSTEMAVRMGDAMWRSLLSTHFESARTAVASHYGREVKTSGDGMLAVFDGPAQALECAASLTRAAQDQGLSVRVGVHVGEVERVGNDVRGISVHAAARIMGQAQGGEVLLSELTRQLASVSNFEFEERGRHFLKGLEGEWQLYALAVSRPGPIG